MKAVIFGQAERLPGSEKGAFMHEVSGTLKAGEMKRGTVNVLRGTCVMYFLIICP
jgi:hypothetical protein